MTSHFILHQDGEAYNWFAGDGFATIVAGVLGALVVVIGYVTQQRAARRAQRAEIYSEAIRAVEEYLEAPFLILRRDKGGKAQNTLSTHISDVQSRLSFYQAQLNIFASNKVSTSYRGFVEAARDEAGPAMTHAWNQRPIYKGSQVPVGSRFSRDQSDTARDNLIHVMRSELGSWWT